MTNLATRTSLWTRNQSDTRWSVLAIIIRKLRNNRKQEDVTASDVPNSYFTTIDDISYSENYREYRYRLYRYVGGSLLIRDDYVKDVTKFKGDLSECPVDIYESVETGIEVNRDRLVHQLVENWGEGRFNVFKIGGNPPRESIFENQFIKKIS
jgi:hypothetical protein